MRPQYTNEQLHELYMKLPEEIQNMAFSDKAASDIEEICSRNGISDERVGEISDLIRDVLFGLLPLAEFEGALKEEIDIEDSIAKKITWEINRFIFYPIRPALENLYRTDSSLEEKTQKETDSKKENEIKTETEAEAETEYDENKPKPPARKDAYREPID